MSGSLDIRIGHFAISLSNLAVKNLQINVILKATVGSLLKKTEIPHMYFQDVLAIFRPDFLVIQRGYTCF